ncbi:hypothetical protein A8709_03325 [Paenibacillus pectinilyticus]|uniref:Phosphodiester glycosidase domain-containing protein n=1 Tax=Paenibacillus pectinilyticus TaxID=512399 RepID=A0A1C0ZYW6_9BACL|nr:hypothetical protein [Paenibacillus pectinilyticus]OCT13300.1 hypothetical protein A8709_03325 [Paenibacillus pectinilyticus]
MSVIRRLLRVNAAHLLIYLLIMLTSFVWTLIWGFHHPIAHPPPLPSAEYSVKPASNGVLLHVIETSPANIGLKAITANVTDRQDNGINGGFFWQGYLLSIAVTNDLPVKGQPGDYGSGWYNTDRKRGTLVWDEKAQAFTIQVVENASELQVTDRTHYWAQGGVSMGLTNPFGWAAQAVSEEMPVINEKRMRSGIVYDRSNNVYLVVAPTPCTGEEFRTAVQEQVGDNQLVDGLFLDGDGSSQLKVANYLLPGDHREVYQMIALLK